MNNLMKFFAFAGVIFLTACGIADDKTNDKDDDFSARAGTLPSNFTNRAVAIIEATSDKDTKEGQLETVANEYRESVFGETSIVDNTRWGFLGGSSSLTSSSGVLMTYSSFVDRGNIVVGILSTTDVGPAFTEANPTATFTGEYMLAVIGTVTARNYGELGAPITLTADFNEGTLGGGGSSDSGAILTVSGTFSGTTLSGNVNYSPPSANRSYDAPLTGLVGQNGAVGSFASSANNGNNRDYAFGGGFLVER